MTRNAHRRHRLNQIKHALHVPLVLVASGALCWAVAKVWNALWTVLLTPP